LVRGSNGEHRQGKVVLLALPPDAAAELLPSSAALAEAAARRPVEVAALDVALRELPNPKHRFALGIDRPLYFSVHSLTARLAPEGGAVIHAMRYGISEQAEAELEELIDRMQPGWRDRTVHRRYLPRMVAAHGHPEPGRPRIGVLLPDVPGVYLAGDWVGEHELLADAAIGSAADAAAAIEETFDVEREPARRVAARA
jgi:phytoene dehydrogenase-like protein